MKLQNITPDEIKIIILIVGVFMAGLIVLHNRNKDDAPQYLESRREHINAEAVQESFVVVDVSGAVWRPGVYTLRQGSRAGDVLDKAMLRPDADVDKINRARVLFDGQKLIVPSVSAASPAELSVARGQPVNINSAGVDELRKLPSIGEGRAREIVEYRERRGPFSSVDELKNIPGIGEATVERLRERVSVK